MRGKSKHNLLVSQPLRRFIFAWWASKGKVTEKQAIFQIYVLKSVQFYIFTSLKVYLIAF